MYQRNVRAGKYGLLFIAMTFVAFFLFEVLKQLRVYPVLVVGAVLATFYVVLLALSEQIGFGAAYALAAAAAGRPARQGSVDAGGAGQGVSCRWRCHPPARE